VKPNPSAPSSSIRCDPVKLSEVTVDEVTVGTARFRLTARILHWTMAVLILTMLGLGAGLIGYFGAYHLLLSLHELLGVVVLVLAVIRVGYRLRHRPPPQIATMTRPERMIAASSELAMYVLFLAQPIVGWVMVSASGTPIILFGGPRLPSIVPADPQLYSALRTVHQVLAYLLLAAVVAHICAVTFHTLVLQDKLLHRMVFRVRR
jgi:cytochrome b561